MVNNEKFGKLKLSTSAQNGSDRLIPQNTVRRKWLSCSCQLVSAFPCFLETAKSLFTPSIKASLKKKQYYLLNSAREVSDSADCKIKSEFKKLPIKTDINQYIKIDFKSSIYFLCVIGIADLRRFIYYYTDLSKHIFIYSALMLMLSCSISSQTTKISQDILVSLESYGRVLRHSDP